MTGVETQEWVKQHTLIQAYAAVIRLQQRGEETDFYSLKEILEQQQTALEAKEQRGLLQHLINYAIQQMRQQKEEYEHICLNLYKLGLVRDLFLVDNTLSATTFNNIANLAVRLKDYNWCKNVHSSI